jgi:hypothetical protein
VSLDLPHLDPCTRGFMLAELEADLADGSLYQSPQLSEEGVQHYPRLLRAAVLGGTDASFAEALSAQDAVRPPSRWQHPREVGPVEALADVTSRLAEREFHRFYIRGLCCRALDQGVDTLVIYRARPADPGRAPADAMIGVRIAVSSLLEDLRGTFRSLPPHGLPQCRDPGLSVRFADDHRAREDDARLVSGGARRLKHSLN